MITPEIQLQRINSLKELGFTYSEIEASYILKGLLVEMEQIEEYSVADFETMMVQLNDYIAQNRDYQIAPSRELSIIDKALITLKSGSEVLNSNKTSAANAIKVVEQLLYQISVTGMTQEIFEQITNVRKRIGVTAKKLLTDRSPYTQAMDMIRGEFTGCENSLKEVEGTKVYELKLHADDYVKKVALAKEEAERQIREEAAKNQEIIDLKASVEKALIEYFNSFLLSKKQAFTNRFNAITLANYSDECAWFTTITFQYPDVHFKAFNYWYTGKRLTDVEVAEIFKSVTSDAKYLEFCSLYNVDMMNLRTEKVDLLNSKKLELERIKAFEDEQEQERLENLRIENERKTANEARQRQLDAEKAENDRLAQLRLEEQRKIDLAKAQRESEEAAALLAEQNAANALQQSQVNVTAAQASTTNMFEEQVKGASIALPDLKTKTGFDVEVVDPKGWLEVFNYWFQIEGAGKDAAWMKKKFQFMLNAMETQALKKNEQLESAHIKYHPNYEAKK